MKLFLSGSIMMGYLVASLYFLKFWRKMHDQLFLFFAIAFAALATERILFICIDHTTEDTVYIRLVRLFAYMCILAAIIDKNRKPRTTHR
jgi:hypothetical protein